MKGNFATRGTMVSCFSVQETYQSQQLIILLVTTSVTDFASYWNWNNATPYE